MKVATASFIAMTLVAVTIAAPNAHSEPEGFTAISRGLSAATPPDDVALDVRPRQGSQRATPAQEIRSDSTIAPAADTARLRPLPGSAFWHSDVRGCRFAQPPANGCHAFSMGEEPPPDQCAPQVAPATRPVELVQSTHRVQGLFAPDREADLRTAIADIPTLHAVSIDFDVALATFAYDPKAAFPGHKPEKAAERLDQLLRQASNGTFSLRPTVTPRDKLQRVEIVAAALDCKACALAAHEMLMKIDGVEQALVSFKEGKITAQFDPEKTNRQQMETVLKEKGVTVGEK